AGGKGCDGVLRHHFDIGSPSHDVKRGAVGARPDGNGDLPPEPRFEGAQCRHRRAAQRGLDRWADDEKPIGRRVGARLALDEPQCLEGQRKAAFAEALRFEHRLAERPAMPWPDNFKMTEPGPAEDLRCGWIAGERGGYCMTHFLPRAATFQPYEIDNDPPAEPAHPQLS